MIKTQNDQNGFSLVEVLIALVVIGLLVGAGHWVYKRSSNKKATDTSTNQPAASQTTAPEAPKVETVQYCDKLEKSCIKYPSDWTKTEETFNDSEINKDRTTIELTNKKYPDVKIMFNPYVYGIGGSCQEGEYIKVEDLAKTTYQIVDSYNTYRDTSDSIQKHFASVAIDGTTSGSDKVSVGNTDCLNFGLYMYDKSKVINHSASGLLTISHTNSDYFTTKQQALDWLNSEGVTQARKILSSLTLE